MDSLVHIRIGKQRKSTGVRRSTDSPYFNEYFVFEFNSSLQNLIDHMVVITVIQPRKVWKRRKIIGNFTLDVATIWAAREHQFYHKWAVITSDMIDKKPEPKGYLKLDIGILTKGEVPHFPTTAETTDDEIEGNLLLPENVSHERVRANFTFSVYQAEDISRTKNYNSKKSLLMDSDHLPSTFVQISFAGLKGKTSIKKNTQNPIWNEKIVFTELFPSLCQRIKIELIFTQNVTPLTHYIYLKSISNDGENGFLPTFGPSYIYLYTSNNFVINYAGKLLLEIKTELLTDLMWSTNSVDIYFIRQVPNLRLWKIEPVLLSCNIYSVTMIDEKLKNKQISFEITMGGPVSENSSTLYENTTLPMKPCADNKYLYWYLAYNNTIISLSILSNWINATTRVYMTNMIRKIYYLLKNELDRIEELFEKNYKIHREEIDCLYLKIAENLQHNCRICLNFIQNLPVIKTDLDAKKTDICMKEIEDIEQTIFDVIHYKSRKKIYRVLLNILCRLYNLIDDVQTCWPDVFIWMQAGNKRIGYHRIPIKEIIYSKNSEEKGLLCGILQNIFIKPTNKSKIKLNFGENSSVLCKVTLQLWIGLYEYREQCLKTVFPCWETAELSEKYNMPIKFICNKSNRFTCNVYIYQGRFQPGADNTGLSDPFVQVTFNQYVLKTKAIPSSIHPIWNETLIFNDIILYGSTEYLTVNTPVLILETYDEDICLAREFVGRGEIIPEINFNTKEEKTIKLRWIKVYNGDNVSGEILVSAELLLRSSEDEHELSTCYVVDNIPDTIKPAIHSFRLDVYFWGVHDLKKICLKTITKPKITIECGGTTMHSTTLQNTKKYLNFSKPYQNINVNIPENEEYFPPLSIKMLDCRGFGCYMYVGTYLANLQDYIYKPMTNAERNNMLVDDCHCESLSTESSTDTGSIIKEIHVNQNLRTNSIEFDIRKFKFANLYMFNKLKKKLIETQKTNQNEEYEDSIDLDITDWWTKFYFSVESADSCQLGSIKDKLKIKIYPCELESVEEFNQFSDILKTFKLYRGKRTGDELLDEENIIATFKGAIRIYKWPPSDMEEYVTETGHSVENGAFQHYPVNEPVPFITRIYVIRAFNLRPKDLSGKSDPYLVVTVGDKQIVDKDNYIPNEINPVFGRCFEMKGVFPNDNILTISIWDRDISSADDFIGETKIDLENRLYTNHWANCGLAKMYINQGPCAWRDQYKPSQILKILCRRNKIEDPEYFENAVKVGPRIFPNVDSVNRDEDVQKEILSLTALNHWKEIPIVGCSLVPEHVETRSLYHYSKPGLEQGKLQLWVDVFPIGDFPPPPPVDVKPRQPLLYELRVIIWNTDNVLLDEDDFFVGEKKSDIYVKGWLTGPEHSQCTDVHYNSISGEGNFNWRFVFPFEYLVAEDKIVQRKKKSVFSHDATESKLPCNLILQVWDNDVFSPDDFLGTLKLSLTRLPRGAKTSGLCKLNILQPGAPTVNLFKTKRHKGWWPFRGKDKQNEEILAGKVEAEIQLLTEEEFRKSPAGIGRSDPQGLPFPKRPDISFSWFKNPLKALKFLLCRRFRCKIIIFFVIILFVLMGLIAIYALPTYTVKRIIGA